MLVVGIHTTQGMHQSKTSVNRVLVLTLENKCLISYQAIDLWRDIPYYLKDLSTFSFAKEIKHYLLSEQNIYHL